jgi:hypothetical protein
VEPQNQLFGEEGIPMGASVRVERSEGEVTVVSLVPPENVAELNGQWVVCQGSISFWEDLAAAPLLEALRSVVASEGGGVVVDLTAMKRGSASVVAVVNDSRLALSERGRVMALVANEDLILSLSLRGLLANCPAARSLSEAVAVAASAPAPQPPDQQTAASLDAIEQRLRSLIRERIGHLCGGGEPPCPPVARLFKAGVASGGQPFPYGGFAWRITGAGTGLRLEYDDHARIADGWGRRYVLSADDTVLVEEGLD